MLRLAHPVRNAGKILVLFALLALPPGGLALAFGPEEALAYRDPELSTASEALEQARWESDWARTGVSAAIEARPVLRYEGETDDPATDSVGGLGLEAGLSLGYRYDEPEILGRTIDVIEAEKRIQELEFQGQKAALMAYGELLRAEIGVDIANARLDRVRRDLAGAQARFEQKQISDTELQRARLQVDTLELDLQQARNDLKHAKEQAADYGLTGTAEFEAVRFEIPEAKLEAVYDYRVLQLALQIAEAQGREQSVYGVVDDVHVSAGYNGTIAALSGRVFLDNGQPGAAIDATYRLKAEDKWVIELGATLRFDERTLHNFSEADLRVAEARQRLEDFARDFGREVATRRPGIEIAEDRLDISLRSLELAQRRIDELEAAVEALPGKIQSQQARLEELQADKQALQERLESASEEERQGVQAQLQDADEAIRNAETARGDSQRSLDNAKRDLDNARFDLPGLQDRVFRDWIDYARQVADYLDVVDGSWATR